MASDTTLLTTKHYLAFGSIIHSFARAENLLQTSLAALTNTESHIVAILTRELGYRAKRDTLYSWMEVTNVRDKDKAEIKGFLDAIDHYSYLRNHISHSIWMSGVRPGSIKPISIKVQGGKGKLYGLPNDQDERDYIEEELTEIAVRLVFIVNSYIQFLRDTGLWDRIDAKMRASIEATTNSPGSTAK
jgi:hypothetical protein